jgi:hypothetical protein
MRPKEFFFKSIRSEEHFDVQKIKKDNPGLWKKLKKQFDIGRQIVTVQLCNGIERLNENILRNYLNDYARRFLKYGPNSFPSSFNVLEPFFVYNRHNSIIQLIEEEESYGLSMIDFLDFVTGPNFKLEDIDLYENIPENIIYNISFTTGSDEINFSNTKGKTFLVGSLSIVRQKNEVSLLIQAGESYDKEEASEYFKNNTRKTIEESISPYKKSLGLKIDYEGEPKVVHYEGRDDLWLHSVALLFDLERKSIDIRQVARDENISYTIITDDFSSFFSKEDSLSKDELKEYIKNHLKQLSNYDAVFDFAKYCLAIPFYIFENEERLVDVTYETSLNSIIKGPLSKRQYASVPSKYKLYAKPFYYLESNSQTVLKSKELTDDSFKIENSGYWKRIGIDEQGFDKNGRIIIGKTWVERNDVYYSTPKGITKVNEIIQFDDENAGYIYVMRQPTHEENIFKVGFTKRIPEKRRKELSNTSSADKFFVIKNYQTKDCVEAEKQIHLILKDYRLSLRREFFRCDLKTILDVCDSVTNKINE